MAPPAKRRKRNTIDESGGEDEGSKQKTLNRHLPPSPDSKPQARASSGTAPASPSPCRKQPTRSSSTSLSQATKTRKRKGSPKPRVRTRNKEHEKRGKTADLVTLFSKQAERGNANGAAKSIPDDILSDPISDLDDIGLHKTAGSSIVGNKAQKRFIGSSQGGSQGSSGQRFLKPPIPSIPKPCPTRLAEEDLRPWSERFGPVNLDELVVHKKKVADVRKWLDDVFAGRARQRLLVLKGAAGTAKTSTVRLLAKDLQYDVMEWRNPGSTTGATRDHLSASAQLEDFLGRGDKFGQLDLDSDAEATVGSRTGSRTGSGRRLILMEEFPNTLMRSSTSLLSFRNTILQFLSMYTPRLFMSGRPSQDAITPIVMIISETVLTTTSASADSFTAHRLLGPEILRHSGASVIEFNAIAPTLLAKALELVVQKEARASGRRKTPGPLVLKRLGEMGDIRSAISSLEFLCLKGDEADWGATVDRKKPNRGTRSVQEMTRSEQDSLVLISQREASLGIFHAVGKVVYNKRSADPFAPGSVEVASECLPEHMAHLSRRKPSEIAVDRLMDETGTDTNTFISALHENYALSCEVGPDGSDSSLDHLNGCLDYLSESDVLCPSWDIFFGGRASVGGYTGKDSGSHVLRQDEMAFHVAVRGLLFSLPSPVKRQRQSTGGRGGGDAFKMFYPTSIKLWKQKEEVGSLVDMWSAKMLKGEDGGGSGPRQDAQDAQNSRDALVGPTAFARKRGAVASRQHTVGMPASRESKPNPARPPPAVPLQLGSSARREMVLERLPYMAHMARHGRRAFGRMRLADLEDMIALQGIGPPTTDESDEDADELVLTAGQTWGTDKPKEETSRETERDEVAGLMAVQSLVLSDDDIEDDW